MILEQNGTAFELKLKNLKVGFILPLKNQSIGGHTSSTETAHQGTKAKELSVSGLLDYSEKDHLKTLREMAEAVDDLGNRIVYNLSDSTAEVGDIRQVIFDKNFKVEKAESFEAWLVAFQLLQYSSVAEAKEARMQTREPVTDTISGQEISAGSATSESGSSASAEKSWIYNTLMKIEQYLGAP